MKPYEYRHVVAFEETNLLGNVYYINHVRWQGRCRELFLKEKAPDVLKQIQSGLLLVTTRCSCEYYAELSAFEEVIVQMRLARLAGQRIDLQFEYYRLKNGREELIARGEQQVACMRKEGSQSVAVPLPDSLLEALRPYAEE
jgi:enediyne biosynthesis thioesterase